MLEGSCLCGAVGFAADRLSGPIVHCNCRTCRKAHSAAFATTARVRRSDFRWTRGEELLKSYTGHNGTVRRFCSHCGSSMTFAPGGDTGELVEFALGTLDSDIELRPDVHIFRDSGAGWYEITDDLPVFPRGRE